MAGGEEVGRGGAKTDEALAVEARRGSEEAFRELVERFHRPVYALLVRIVRQPELAEDLAQETFLKAWKALARFDPGRKILELDLQDRAQQRARRTAPGRARDRLPRCSFHR